MKLRMSLIARCGQVIKAFNRLPKWITKGSDPGLGNGLRVTYIKEKAASLVMDWALAALKNLAAYGCDPVQTDDHG